MIKISSDVFEKLKSSVDFFGDFSDQELHNFLRCMNPEHFKKGEIIFEENVPGDKMYIVINGKVSITKRLGKKEGKMQETELAVIGSGKCFGEMGLIDRRARSAKATAKENALLFSVTDQMLMTISANRQFFLLSFKLYRNFAKLLANRLRDTNIKVVDLEAKSGGHNWI